MTRTLVLTLAIMLMGGTAMAIDSNPPRQPTLPQDPPAAGSLDEFFQTPQGQSAKRLLEYIQKGDMEAAQREYEAAQKQFGLTPRVPAPAPQAPRRPVDLGPPMQLPPEAR